ncbi:MAG: hypothetical protein MJ059_07710 [Lachnospiraceae bacterium]|nr:hypothetical protein [Lachnospiraceae bacterium]
MQEVKTFYDRSEGGVEREINKYLSEHPDRRITLISSTQIGTNQVVRLCVTVVFE